MLQDLSGLFSYGQPQIRLGRRGLISGWGDPSSAGRASANRALQTRETGAVAPITPGPVTDSPELAAWKTLTSAGPYASPNGVGPSPPLAPNPPGMSMNDPNWQPPPVTAAGAAEAARSASMTDLQNQLSTMRAPAPTQPQPTAGGTPYGYPDTSRGGVPNLPQSTPQSLPRPTGGAASVPGQPVFQPTAPPLPRPTSAPTPWGDVPPFPPRMGQPTAAPTFPSEMPKIQGFGGRPPGTPLPPDQWGKPLPGAPTQPAAPQVPLGYPDPRTGIPRMGKGGLVTKPTVALLAEKGRPEAVVPVTKKNKPALRKMIPKCRVIGG